MSSTARFRVRHLLEASLVVGAVLAVVILYGQVLRLNHQLANATSELDRLQNPVYARIDFVGDNRMIEAANGNQAWIDELEGSTWESRNESTIPMVLQIGRKRVITQRDLPGYWMQRQVEQHGDELISYNCKFERAGSSSKLSLVFDPAVHRMEIFDDVQTRAHRQQNEPDPQYGFGARIDDDLLLVHLVLADRRGIRVDTIFKRVDSQQKHHF